MLGSAREIENPIAHPKFGALHHVSLPCRDLKETISFYCELLGADLIHEQLGFTLVSLGSTYIGISDVGTSWIEPKNEYPHTCFAIKADDAVALRELLDAHGTPVSPAWTRGGTEGYPDAANLPKTWKAQGHGNVMDVADTYYKDWLRPSYNKLATTSEPPMKEEFSKTVY